MAELLEFVGIVDESSWRKWAKNNHPDKGGDESKFKVVQEAYDRLIKSKSNSTSTTSTSNSYANTKSKSKSTSAKRNGGNGGNGSENPTTDYYKFFENMNKHTTHKSGYCYHLDFLYYCPQRSQENSNFCADHHAIYCHKLIEKTSIDYKTLKTVKSYRQCANKRRGDDIYCTIHSSKEKPNKKPLPPVRQCNAIIKDKKGNNKQCGKRSREDYCFLHRNRTSYQS